MTSQQGSDSDSKQKSASVDPRLRIGILDIAALVIVLCALFLPRGSSRVEGAYDRIRDGNPREITKSLADLEGRLAADNNNQRSAEELARQLEAIGQHDQALRVAGAALSIGGPSSWRALRAISYAHAERLELEPALQYAERAIRTCEQAANDCDPQDQIRLRLYHDELEVGVKAEKEGIDPVKQPDRFRQRIHELHPTSQAPRK